MRILVASFLLFFHVVGLGAGSAEPLAAETAFQFSSDQFGSEVWLHWAIQPGIYLYKNSFKVESVPAGKVKMGEIEYPKGIIKKDEVLGTYQVYYNNVDLKVPLIYVAANGGKLGVTFQGCAVSGFCYPPSTQYIAVLTPQEAAKHVPNKPKPTHVSSNEGTNPILLLLSFLGFGILLSFTPCVLPLIPILSSLIVGQGSISTWRAFSLSLAYVIGMALAYSVAGLIAGLAGSHLQAIMQAPWIIATFSALFVLLALSLFDVYELRLPNFIHQHITHISNKQKSGTFIGVFIMGVLSILIVSPCVTAPLIAALSIISKQGNVVLGGFALFMMGLGMGVPLLIIGTLGSRLLPKRGAWMHAIKIGMGVIMIALAIYMMSRILPGPVTLALWGLFSLVLGVYLGAFKTGAKIKQGFGLGMITYGVLLLFGAAMGNTDPLQPLARVNKQQEHNLIAWNKITTIKQLNEIISQNHGKFIFVDFRADWCVSCRKMENSTYLDPKFAEKFKNFVMVEVDLTTVDDNAKAIMQKYHIVAPPTIIIFNGKGQWLQNQTWVGEASTDDLSHLANLAP